MPASTECKTAGVIFWLSANLGPFSKIEARSGVVHRFDRFTNRGSILASEGSFLACTPALFFGFDTSKQLGGVGLTSKSEFGALVFRTVSVYEFGCVGLVSL